MKTLEALTTLTGDYGHVQPGDVFSTHDETANSLIERNLAKLSTKTAEVESEVVHQLHVDGETPIGNPDNQEPLTLRGNEDLDENNPDVSEKATEPAEKEDTDAAGRQTKEDKTVTTRNTK